VELPSPGAGTIGKILKQKGDTAKVGEVIGYLEEGKTDGAEKKSETKASEAKAPEPKPAEKPKTEIKQESPEIKAEQDLASPRLSQIKPAQEKTRSERLREESTDASAPAERRAPARPEQVQSAAAPSTADRHGSPDRSEEVVPMSKLRRTVAERLVEAQHNAALLTTFNEIDMSSVMSLRKEHGEAFQKKYNVKLGFMSFFVKAAIDSLKQFPALNAEIRGTDIFYHNYFDIGVAIGSGKGLVVPVLRNAERLSFAEIEMAIGDFGRRAQENKLKPDELQGGTFTITNGGVYGSLLSTPIVNPPQSGVLGMHGIQDRPVAREGQVVIRPMMYVALTYDHRIVDGREAVTFLKRMKDTIENPARMLIEV
jgi:2-oxoglutarate dehydrogenase E2 component (dihydrolipoamide succinyltransferase)